MPRLQGTNTAAIGDPRNDENLIVHNFITRCFASITLLLTCWWQQVSRATFSLRQSGSSHHHYQWAVIHDLLGKTLWGNHCRQRDRKVSALSTAHLECRLSLPLRRIDLVTASIRDLYWVNFNFGSAKLEQVFEFNQNRTTSGVLQLGRGLQCVL